MAKEDSLYAKTDSKIRRISGTITALAVVVGAVAGVCSWVSNRFAEAVSNQIGGFQREIELKDMKQEQSLTRLELIMLMEHDPENNAEIEKVAKHYFVELDGDWYMTGLYSQWAREHGGDISFMMKKE